MIPKLKMPPNQLSCYRPVSLPPIISKLYKNLRLKRTKSPIELENLISSPQFRLRINDSTIHQVDQITNMNKKLLEKIKVQSAVVLDVEKDLIGCGNKTTKTNSKKYCPKSIWKL